jgi:hypothetical protein
MVENKPQPTKDQQRSAGTEVYKIPTENKSQSPKEQQPDLGLEIYRITVELVRGIAWPLLVLGILWTYRDTIRTIAIEVPKKFSAATKVAVGSLTLEIQEQARVFGSSDLATRLGKLSPEAVTELIKTGRSRMTLIGESKSSQDGRKSYFIDKDARIRAIQELAANGLLEVGEDLDRFLSWIHSERFERLSTQGIQEFRPVSPLSPDEERRLRDQYFRLNELGVKAWDAINEAILQQLSATKKQDVDSSTRSR